MKYLFDLVTFDIGISYASMFLCENFVHKITNSRSQQVEVLSVEIKNQMPGMM